MYKVWLLDGHEIWLLIHIEVQSQHDSQFRQRMFIYNYRAFDLYHKPVISLAILGDESKTWRPNSYQYGLEESQVLLKFASIKMLDYSWAELQASKNPFSRVIMAHLKTKTTTSNLTERAKWKWQLVRSLYEEGWSKFEIINLFKFIDKMMTLPPPLALKFTTQLNEYEEEKKMPFLSTLEEMALERGQEMGAKETRKKDIINLLQKRFGNLTNDLIQSINQINDLSVLDLLILETISVNSVAEFQELINQNSVN